MSLNCPTFPTGEAAAEYRAKTGSGVGEYTAHVAVDEPSEPQDARNEVPEAQPPLEQIKLNNGSVISVYPGGYQPKERLGWMDAESYNAAAQYQFRRTLSEWHPEKNTVACRSCRKAVHPCSSDKLHAGYFCADCRPKALKELYRPRTRASYLKEWLHGPNLLRTINATIKACSQVEFEAVAYRGMSGSLVAPAVAAFMGKDLIMVRKTDGPDSGSHSDYRTEGRRDAIRYVIVDDFISSGSTVAAILEQIYTDLNYQSRCVGIVEYTKLPFPVRRKYTLGKHLENCPNFEGLSFPILAVPVDTVL
jgi:hypothetical protein